MFTKFVERKYHEMIRKQYGKVPKGNGNFIEIEVEILE